MLFDDLTDEQRQRAIHLLEESLFAASTVGAHYFHDVPPTLPGFTGGPIPSTFRVTVKLPA